MLALTSVSFAERKMSSRERLFYSIGETHGRQGSENGVGPMDRRLSTLRSFSP